VNFDVQIVHSIEEIGQEAWDRLSAGRPFASYRWYRFGETVLVDDLPIYLILSQGGEAVARATLWLKRREQLPIAYRVARYLMEMVFRRWPLLVCRSPLSSTSGLILPEPPLHNVALETIARLAQDLLKQHHASFLLFDYLERQEAELAGWPDTFAKVLDLDPGTCLAIAWPDFEGYLAHLGKKRRYNIRRNSRLAVESGIEIKHHRTVTDVDQAMILHKNVNRRYKSPDEPWMRGALEHAGMVDAVWLTAEREGQVVGCELMLGDGGDWFVTGIGLDYSTEYAYFLLGYEDIRYAIEHGARVLRWGTETYDVKRRLGFEPEDSNNLVFTSRGALLQRLGRWLEKMDYSRVAHPDGVQW
jgi:predicted N-acyltransferase